MTFLPPIPVSRFVPWALPLLAVAAVGSDRGAERPGPDAPPPWPIAALELPDPEATATETAPGVDPLVRLELSDGPAGTVPPQREEDPAVEALSPERTRSLLDRLPPSEERRPEEAAADPAPGSDHTGRTSAEPEAPPARVEAVLPAGEVSLAPHVTVVFSRPMVALGEAGESRATEPPVTLEPEPPGRWRWLDVRTLRFEPHGGRLPGATELSLRVDGDATAADGAPLEEPPEARIATRGVRAVGGRPHEEVVDAEPLLLLAFDQDVRPRDVLASAVLEADGEPHPLRLAREEELEEEPRYRAAAREAGEDRWVALQPKGPLPLSAEARLTLDEDLASAEGPRPAGRPQELRFRVRGPLELEEAACSDPDAPCQARPHAVTWVGFSNPLDTVPAVEELVTVDPEPEGLRLRRSGRHLSLQADWRPHGTYRVTFHGELGDRFGERLEEPEERVLHFGAAAPLLRVGGGPLVTLDPEADPVLPVDTRALEAVDVELHRVEPEDWPAFIRALRMRGAEPREAVPGEPVASQRLTAPDGGEGYSTLQVDLAPALEEGRGHVVARIAEPRKPGGQREDGPLRELVWVQATDLSLAAAWDPARVTARAATLAEGRPLEGVEVALPSSGGRAVTDADGLAALELTEMEDSVLVARTDSDAVIVPHSGALRFRGTWSREPGHPRPNWGVYTDRLLYRKGEELRLHGWLRDRAGEDGLDLELPSPADSVRYAVDWRGRSEPSVEGTVPISERGSFVIGFQVPEDAPSGRAAIHLEVLKEGEAAEGASTGVTFQVEEFRRPEYEVTVEADPERRVMGRPHEVRVEARYHGGPGLPGAPVTWRVEPELARQHPPGWAGWAFGADSRRRATAGDAEEAAAVTREAATDGEGLHTLRVDVPEDPPPFPLVLESVAEVRDVDRQAGSDEARTLLHPARITAGIRPRDRWTLEGDTLDFQVAVVDLEGEALGDAVPEVRVERVRPEEGREGERLPPLETLESHPADCREAQLHGPDGSAAGEGVPGFRCRYHAREEGRLRLVAEVRDDEGRLSRSEELVRVRPGGSPLAGAVGPGRGDPEVTLRAEDPAEGKAFAPGDTVGLEVRSEVHPARGELVVTAGGQRRVLPVELDGPERRVEVPVREADRGTMRFDVSLAAVEPPRERHGDRATVEVGVEDRRLHVEVAPREEEAEPGQETEVAVRVRDADGEPVPDAEVVLWAVDEAILAVAGYETPDPLPDLHEDRGMRVTRHAYLEDHVAWLRRPLGPGALSGRILDADRGRARSGHVIRVRGPDGEAETTADRDGEFALEGLEPGTYVVEVRDDDGAVVLKERSVELRGNGADMGEVLVRAPPRVSDPEAEVSVAAAYRPPGVVAVAPQDLPAPPDVDSEVELRERFTPLAAFVPGLRTDAEGTTSTAIRLPDTVTRYRIMATAAHGARQLGSGEGELVARKSLVLRPSLPSFLHPGDRAELSFVVQNLSGEDRAVEVAARAQGVELNGPAGARVEVPAGDRREVRFPASADATGGARVQAVAAAGEHADAVAVEVPVRPAVAPRVASLHAAPLDDEPVRLPVEVPTDALPDFGELEVAVSGSLAGALGREMAALTSEPTPAPGRTTTRLLGLLALEPHLEDLRSEALPEPDELRRLVREDVAFLEELYRDELRGSRGPTPPSGIPGSGASTALSPYAFLDGALALARAWEEGHDLRESTLRGVRNRIGQRVDALAEGPLTPRLAYEAYVLHAFRDLPDWEPEHEEAVGAVRRLAAEAAPEDLSAETLARLLVLFRGPDSDEAGAQGAARDDGLDRAAVVQGLLEELEGRALATGGTVTFQRGEVRSVPGAAPGEERLLLESRRRADGAVLSALLEAAPDHPLLPGLARGLVAHRGGGGHPPLESLTEAGWLLRAVGDYVRVREEPTSELAARVALNDRVLLEGPLRGDGPPARTASAPLAEVPSPTGEDGAAPPVLAMERSGSGTLYGRASLRWAPADPFQPAADEGFVVTRRYEAVDDPDDVWRDEEGAWRIRAGARVRVRVTVAVPERRHQVRLRDPVPAGLEPVNPRVEGPGLPDDPEARAEAQPVGTPSCRLLAPAADPGSAWANWTECLFHARVARGGPWYSHREVGRDRLAAFAPLVPAGTYETTYLARATAPGRYAVAGSEVHESLSPGTRGRGGAHRVIIETR